MQFIQKYFGALLLLSCFAGMFLPSMGESTNSIVIIALGFIIFFSFFQVNFNYRFLVSDIRLSISFWFIRFLMLPVIAFLTVKRISEFHALILLLSLLLPSAVSSPSFSVIFKGRPDISIKILVFSSFLSVITIPVLSSLFVGSGINLPAGKMLLTLIYTILIPFIFHLPLRKIRNIRSFTEKYNALLTLTGLSVIFIMVTARNKSFILEYPWQVGLYALEAIVLYAFMYSAGYLILPGQNKNTRRTLSISSGANNIGLGVTITALFFPGNMNIFFIVAQIVWIIAIIPLRWIFKIHR